MANSEGQSQIPGGLEWLTTTFKTHVNPVICKKPLLPYHFLAYVVRAENSILISKVKNAEALPEPLPKVTQLRDVEP